MNLIKRKQDEVSQPKPKKYMRRGEKEALSKGAVKDADSDEEEQPETGTTDTRTASERRRDDTMKQREKEEDEKERTAQKKARDILEKQGFDVLEMSRPFRDLSIVAQATGEPDRNYYVMWAEVWQRPKLVHADIPDRYVPIWQAAGWKLNE